MNKLILIFTILFSITANAQSGGMLLPFDEGLVFIEADNANAVTDQQGEVDGKDGWFATTASLFESQEVVVNVGSSALHVVASGSIGRMFIDIRDEYNLIEGIVYTLSFDIAHDGTGIDPSKWGMGIASNTTDITTFFSDATGVVKTQTNFVSYEEEFTHSSDSYFFVFRELNSNNDGGIYLDNFKIK